MSQDHSTVRYCVLEGHPGSRVGSDGSYWRLYDNVWTSVSGWIDDDGDRWIMIPRRAGGKRKRCKIAVLVLTYFVGPKPPGLECCHRDDDKGNNNVSNLYWGTHRQNMIDCVRNGRRRYWRGEEHHAAKLTAEDVREIRRRWREENPRPTKTGLAREYRVTFTAISLLLAGETWKTVD